MAGQGAGPHEEDAVTPADQPGADRDAPATDAPRVLGESFRPLVEEYDLAMLDLDGVVYVGAAAVPGADQHLAAAAARGMSLAYVTNNASRPPGTVAAHLRDLGIDASDEDVVTSAQAAARLVAERVEGGRVFVIGGEGLYEALTERGLEPTQEVEPRPVAVVSGYHPELRWKTVIDGAILVREGIPWIASNTDMTVPTPNGPGPGNGVLVRAVAQYAGVEPQVAGKPEPPLFLETSRRVGGRRPLVVGDRLDTDIEGAVRTGYDSLLVMTGVTGLEELASARRGTRPTYVSADLGGLLCPHETPVDRDGHWSLGGWDAEVDDRAVLSITGDGSADDWWRLVAATAWDHLDRSGEPVDIAKLRAPQPGAGAPEG